MSTSNLRLFTRFQPPAWQTIELSRLLANVCTDKRRQLASRSLTLDLELTEEISLYGDWQLISQAIGNLIDNAAEASQPGGRVIVSIESDSQSLKIHVQDEGPGIEIDAAQRVCRPFFTTKPGSLGLGLAIVRQVAEAHGGQVRIANSRDAGAHMTLRLPRRQASQAA